MLALVVVIRASVPDTSPYFCMSIRAHTGKNILGIGNMTRSSDPNVKCSATGVHNNSLLEP